MKGDIMYCEKCGRKLTIDTYSDEFSKYSRMYCLLCDTTDGFLDILYIEDGLDTLSIVKSMISNNVSVEEWLNSYFGCNMYEKTDVFIDELISDI